MNKDLISLKLMEFMAPHRGRENAVPRDHILAHLQPFDSALDDRRLREIYIRQPLAVCDEGLFIPIRPYEVKDFFDYLCKKIPREQAWARVKIVLTYFPNLSWSSDSDKQMELF